MDTNRDRERTGMQRERETERRRGKERERERERERESFEHKAHEAINNKTDHPSKRRHVSHLLVFH
jgi:hypothetical protein